MKSDIEIARSTKMKPIAEIGKNLGIEAQQIENYGKFIAKINLEAENQEQIEKSKLILVTAITPTKSGIGKTTVSVGLALGMEKIGKKAVVALREPSLGPCFGMKGGAAGGGYAQVVPMEKINLHFTGDFHAITSAHNTISALLDNYIHQNRNNPNATKISKIVWKRVLDVNDRNLRNIVTGLGGEFNGVTSESGFDITPASELMAILCLSKDEDDLRRRIGNILLAYTAEGKPFYVNDLGVTGAITVLMRDALQPNLVQTTENTPAIIHGGPFANIAHGCNSIIATKMAMSYGDYAITEAGFGADLGAEKFYDIKCRQAGLDPDLTVLVVTIGALKLHGGGNEKALAEEDLGSIKLGLANMQKHIDNIRGYDQKVIVAYNKFGTDTPAETALLMDYCKEHNIPIAENSAFAKGGEGAMDLAKLVVETIDDGENKPLNFAYKLEDSVEDKALKVAQKIYGAKELVYTKKAKNAIKRIYEHGWDKFPICIAKTQYSFSQDPNAYGVPKDFTMEVADVIVNSGSEMIVFVMGSIMRMPGLPKVPQAMHIDIVDGEIVGLS